MRLPRILTVIPLVLAACGGPSSTAPVKTAAVSFDPKNKQYQLTQVQLTTVSDLAGLKGSVANMIGGAQVVIDSNDPSIQNAQTEEDLHRAILKNPGGGVRASFITSGDVQWPVDFHSENMVTTYYNFERAFSFYSRFGWSQEQAGTPPVYYFPTFILADQSKAPQKDNAMFFPLLGGFMILPFNQLQDIPLPMNLGVIGHEYSHFMVNTRVYDKQGIPQPYLDFATPSSGVNILKSFDEGFADLFGTGVTCGEDLANCDPNFISDSIEGTEAPLRNLDAVHCLDQTLNSHLMNDSSSTFLGQGLEYRVGTVLASSVWRAAKDHDVVAALGTAGAVEKAMKSVYDSLDDPKDNHVGLKQLLQQIHTTPNKLRVDTGVANLVVYHAADPKLGTALCSAFMDRLGTIPMSQCQTLCKNPLDIDAIDTSGNGCLCACLEYPAAHSYGECAQ